MSAKWLFEAACFATYGVEMQIREISVYQKTNNIFRYLSSCLKFIKGLQGIFIPTWNIWTCRQKTVINLTYRYFGKTTLWNACHMNTCRFHYLPTGSTRSQFIIPPISLWNAVTVYFTSRRFMIAINISINDLLNYNCDRYLPTQLQGGVDYNL